MSQSEHAREGLSQWVPHRCTMERLNRVVPTWAEIARVPNVQPGELAVVKAYEALESPSGPLTVYFEPYLANRHPDVAVLNEEGGVLLVEVKDWSINSSLDYRKIKAGQQQALEYRDVLLELTHPQLDELLVARKWSSMGRKIHAAVRESIRCCLVCTDIPRTELLRHAGQPMVMILGSECLGDPELMYRPPPGQLAGLDEEVRVGVTECLRQLIARWLVPPYHRAEQGTIGEATLTRAQRAHALPRAPGAFRLEGPAGCGKTLVIAHKAARLASEGKRVLVLCFNITLVHYIRDLIAAMKYDFDWENIAIYHFHGLLKHIRVAKGAVFGPESTEQSKDQFLRFEYPRLVRSLLDEDTSGEFLFDAVLIDEGQDFDREYLQVAGRCVRGGGELLLCRDHMQNVYEIDLGYQDDWAPARTADALPVKFSGPWAKLTTAFRMSEEVCAAISRFVGGTFGGSPVLPDPGAIQHRLKYSGRSFCRWENIDPTSWKEELDRVIHTVTTAAGNESHPSDLGVLFHNNSEAWEAVKWLETRGIPAVHVYDKEGRRDSQCFIRFRKGDGRIKVCTGHSFKGFEVWGVIVVCLPSNNDHEQAHWLYTCMGRAIEGLWVLNGDPKLNRAASLFNGIVG